MREILFRGKRKDNGEWATATSIYKAEYADGLRFYINSLSEVTVYFNCDGNITRTEAELDCEWLEVIQETVSQFTGLTDKNGKKIFEGDILDYWSSYSETLCGSYETVVFGVNNCSCCHAVYGWSTKNKYGYGRYIDTPEECVVIGNIHDNPELLEG